MCRTLLISVGYDQQVRFFDVVTWRNVMSFEIVDSQVNCMHLCCENRFLVVGGFASLRVFDLERGSGLVDSDMGAGGGGKFCPAVVARHEVSGLVNFSSIGSFRLKKEAGSFACGSFGGVSQAESVPELYGTNSMGWASMCDTDVGTVLYATAEDGSLRFLDFRFNSKELVLLKLIRTGASITCSALSPDFRFILTGSQIGQVSVWHVPSIMNRCIQETKKKSSSPYHSNTVNGQTSCALGDAVSGLQKNGPNSQGGLHSGGKDMHGNGSQHTVVNSNASSGRDRKSRNIPGMSASPSDDACEEHLFGSKPLQTISFPNDYSAVRSLAISPVGWWGVVAMHCGNLHFIGMSQCVSGYHPHKDNAFGSSSSGAQGGSRDDINSSASPASPVSGGKQQSAVQRDAEEKSSSNKVPITSPHEGEVGSKQELIEGEDSSVTQRVDPSGCPIASGGTSNPCSSAVQDASEGLNSRVGEEGSASVTKDSAGSVDNHLSREPSKLSSDDAAANTELKLLRGLEGQGNGQGKWESDLADDKGIDSDFRGFPVDSCFSGVEKGKVQKNKIQTDLHMKVLHSFQPHYKCILKVIISPNNKMLVTCSADYSVGRFLIPKFLQTWRIISHQQNTTEETDEKQSVKSVLGHSIQQLSLFSASDLSEINESGINTGDKTNKESPISGPNATLSRLSKDPKDGKKDPPTTSINQTPLNASHDVGTDKDAASLKEPETHTPKTGTKTPLGQNEGFEVGKEAAVQPAAEPSHNEVELLSSTIHRDTRASASTVTPIENGQSSPPQQQQLGLTSLIRFSALSSLVGHSRWVWDAVFSECSSYLFTASSDASIRTWNCVLDAKDDPPNSRVVDMHERPVTGLLLYTERKKFK